MLYIEKMFRKTHTLQRKNFFLTMTSICCHKVVDLRYTSHQVETSLQIYFKQVADEVGVATCVIKNRDAVCSSHSVLSCESASRDLCEIIAASFDAHKVANAFTRAAPPSKTDIKSLARCFHLPLDQAASVLGLCPTLLKRAARKAGLKKWPYRKVSSIRRLQDRLRATRDAHTSLYHRRALDQRINELQADIDAICHNATPE